MALLSRNNGPVVDLQEVKARRFLDSLGEHAFVAIVIDEDTGTVRMYTKGVSIDKKGMRKIHALLEELESDMTREPDGTEDQEEEQV